MQGGGEGAIVQMQIDPKKKSVNERRRSVIRNVCKVRILYALSTRRQHQSICRRPSKPVVTWALGYPVGDLFIELS